MKSPVRTLPLLLAALSFCATAAQDHRVQVQANAQQLNDLRNTVEAYRASRREEVRREESVAGRRLTAAELAELREQVRAQWRSHVDAEHSAEASAQASAAAPRAPHPSRP